MSHCAELTALVERLWPGRVPWIGEDFLIGGYSISAQDSPETQLADEGETPLPPGPERFYRWQESEDQVMREWVPLAQFSVPHKEYVIGRFPDPPRGPRRQAIRQGAVLLRVHRVNEPAALRRPATVSG